MLPNEWERSEWRVPNTPRWEGDLVDRTTGVHRNSHSASREQPQSRKTGEGSVRRNIPVIRTIPCVQIVCPRGHSCSIPNKIFRGIGYLHSASNVQTHGMTLSGKAHSIAEQDKQAKCGPPKFVRHTAFLKDEKGRRAGAEGIWSPPAQQGNCQQKVPPSCW